ncbi:MAG: hypothetical protein P1T08_16755 [Acidimicrobiia bacterium]|nr:hypothetical protein [Acidimicrobiia bacterium]
MEQDRSAFEFLATRGTRVGPDLMVERLQLALETEPDTEPGQFRRRSFTRSWWVPVGAAAVAVTVVLVSLLIPPAAPSAAAVLEQAEAAAVQSATPVPGMMLHQVVDFERNLEPTCEGGTVRIGGGEGGEPRYGTESWFDPAGNRTRGHTIYPDGTSSDWIDLGGVEIWQRGAESPFRSVGCSMRGGPTEPPDPANLALLDALNAVSDPEADLVERAAAFETLRGFEAVELLAGEHVDATGRRVLVLEVSLEDVLGERQVADLKFDPDTYQLLETANSIDGPMVRGTVRITVLVEEWIEVDDELFDVTGYTKQTG